MLRVVALGAVCELSADSGDGSKRFTLEEFADLCDGRRVVWRRGRGFSSWSRWVNMITDESGVVRDNWAFETRRSLADNVRGIGEPDDPDDETRQIIAGLSDTGIKVDPDIDIEALPYKVEFGQKVLSKFAD